MARDVLYPHITDALAAAHPEWVQWSDQHGWLPRVAGGATEDDNGGDDQGQTDEGDTDQSDEDNDGAGDDAPKLTQAQVDAIVEKRLGKAKKSWEKEQADAAEKAKMTEADKLKAEKAEAEQDAADKATAADARVIRSEAKVAAVAAGVRPDRAAAFLRVIDLDGIEIGDDGEPDAAAIKAAIETTLKDFPEFKGTLKAGASGSEHGDVPKNKPTNLGEAIANHYADA